MRKLLPFFFIILAACGNKSDKKNTGGDHLISMDGLDELKIGMKQEEVEKLIDQKFILENAVKNAESWVDTTTVKYKNTNILLHFQREYDNDNSFHMFLTGLECSDPAFRTSSGIGIGNSKDDIVNAYPDNIISMGPDADMVNDTTWITSKTRYLIHVKNEFSRQIIFRLDNKKLSSFEVTMVFDDSE